MRKIVGILLILPAASLFIMGFIWACKTYSWQQWVIMMIGLSITIAALYGIHFLCDKQH